MSEDLIRWWLEKKIENEIKCLRPALNTERMQGQFNRSSNNA
jgi:hypothetical protein